MGEVKLTIGDVYYRSAYVSMKLPNRATISVGTYWGWDTRNVRRSAERRLTQVEEGLKAAGVTVIVERKGSFTKN